MILYVAAHQAAGGGTDYVLVSAGSEEDVLRVLPDALDVFELTTGWFESEYEGVAVLGTYDGQ